MSYYSFSLVAAKVSPWLQPFVPTPGHSGSVTQLASQVDTYIANKLATGKIRVSPSKFRLIVDLSDPQSESINDGIATEWCSFKYASVHDTTAQVKGGAYMAKLDLTSTYRMVPIQSVALGYKMVRHCLPGFSSTVWSSLRPHKHS